jgi:hypothetical protein
MEIPDKNELDRKMKREFENNDGYYFVSKMLQELDVKTVASAINK